MLEVAYLRSGLYRVVQTSDGFEVQTKRTWGNDLGWRKLRCVIERTTAIKLLESYAR